MEIHFCLTVTHLRNFSLSDVDDNASFDIMQLLVPSAISVFVPWRPCQMRSDWPITHPHIVIITSDESWRSTFRDIYLSLWRQALYNVFSEVDISWYRPLQEEALWWRPERGSVVTSPLLPGSFLKSASNSCVRNVTTLDDVVSAGRLTSAFRR